MVPGFALQPFLVFRLCDHCKVVTMVYCGEGNVHRGESSLVPGFPLRSALISLSVISWIVFDVLHSFERLPVLQYSCRVHQTHMRAHSFTHSGSVLNTYCRHLIWPELYLTAVDTHTCLRSCSVQTNVTELLMFYPPRAKNHVYFQFELQS